MIIDLIVYDGIDELDALGPLEVLRNAERLGADITSRLVTRQAQPVVRGSYGLRFTPDGVYQPGEAEIVVVPGGGWVGRADVGAWGESQRGEWLPLLAEAAGTARVVAGVCTGTMLLAHAGVVGGRRAATHHDAWRRARGHRRLGREGPGRRRRQLGDQWRRHEWDRPGPLARPS